MSTAKPHAFSLMPSVMHYPWGRSGERSLVAQLAHEVDPSKPCAELWVGAHPRAPSLALLPEGSIALDKLLQQRGRELLGDVVFVKYGGTLPFLLKVLSIDKPLSIQAHPDKARAEVLHKRDPEHYPDANHKPEMALALSPVELLFGFYSEAEMGQILLRYPEIAAVIAAVGNNAGAVRGDETLAEIAYRALLSAPQTLLRTQGKMLLARLAGASDKTRTDEWFLTLSRDYPPGDVGLLCVFILRYTVLNAGDAIFISPNTPHAYLSGELVECMASSDNVVRAGLTHKYCDIPTLVEMADFTHRTLRSVPFKSTDNATTQYFPQVAEFTIEELRKQQPFICPLHSGRLKIALCLSGDAMVLVEGEDAISLAPGAAACIGAGARNVEIIGKSCHLIIVAASDC